MIYSGMSRGKALLFNFLAATVATLGTLISPIMGPRLEHYAVSLMPFTAGGFISLAGSDLIPGMKKEARPARSLMGLKAIILGVAIMASLVLLE
jgi:zinc transporter ZupT